MAEPLPQEHDSEAWTGKLPISVNRTDPPASDTYTTLSYDPETWRRINPLRPPHDTSAMTPCVVIIAAAMPTYLLLDWLLGDVAVLTGGLVSTIGGEVLKPVLLLVLCFLVVVGVCKCLPRQG